MLYILRRLVLTHHLYFINNLALPEASFHTQIAVPSSKCKFPKGGGGQYTITASIVEGLPPPSR